MRLIWRKTSMTIDLVESNEDSLKFIDYFQTGVDYFQTEPDQISFFAPRGPDQASPGQLRFFWSNSKTPRTLDV